MAEDVCLGALSASYATVYATHMHRVNPYLVLRAKLGSRDAATIGAVRAAIKRALGEDEEAISVSVADRFATLSQKWREETKVLSSLSDIFEHPAYREILTMGQDALPLILRELEVSGGLWFQALQALAGQNPIAAEDAGRIRVMREKWIAWGRERGYI